MIIIIIIIVVIVISYPQLASELAAGGADGDLEDRETNSRVEEFLLGRVSTSGGDKTVVFQLAQVSLDICRRVFLSV